MRPSHHLSLLLLVVFMLAGIGPVLAAAQNPEATKTAATHTGVKTQSGELQSEIGFNVYAERWTGDFDTMVHERIIRVLTVYGLGRYYLDEGREKGLTHDLYRAFEDYVNDRLSRENVRIHVVFIPVARDELLSGLIEGRGDIAAAQLSITPEREAIVAFTNPLTKELSEVLVTGPSAPAIGSIDELSGQTIHLRASSSYSASIEQLNRRFRAEGKPEILVVEISEYLEDADILDMVNSGLLNWAVVDDYKARTLANFYDGLTIREDIVFRSGVRLGAAVRKDSPKLLAELNEFMKTHRQGTLQGNMLINRYIKNFDFTKNALSDQEYKRFQAVADIFENYGEQYGIDYLLVAAQGYQESGLKQSAKSGAGAVGIMQLLPSTAADKNVGIPDISSAEANIHAGIKYLDFIRNRYFDDPQIDRFNQTLFAFAAYNAGPARVASLRKKAADQGYDPNVWFDNVEMIAAREIGRETVQYVANILKYYVAYRLSTEQRLKHEAARAEVGSNPH